MTISKFIDSGKSVYLEGNMIAYYMSFMDPDFLKKFGVQYAGTSNLIYPPVEVF